MKKDNNADTEKMMNTAEDMRLYAAENKSVPIVNGNDDDDLNEDDITPEEIALLDATDYDSATDIDDENLNNAELDRTDEDGDELNEKSSSTDYSAKDLDIPGAEADDADEEIGEEDEENNDYSEADTE